MAEVPVEGASIDAIGVHHAPAGADPRIVSLVPSLTELLFALDLGDRLVGRTHYCIHPADALAAVPSLGGTKKIRIDRLADLRPTHVLVNIDENPKDLAEAIAAEGIEVIVTHPQDPRDNLALYRLLGAIFGRERQAEALCRRFEEAHARLLAQAPWLERRVLYLIWKDPWMTVAPDTYIARTLALVGWRVVGTSDGARYPEVRLDSALLAGTDLVLLASEPYPFAVADLAAFRAAWPDAAAALIDAERVSWYGDRAIQGLDYLAAFARQPLRETPPSHRR